MRQLALCLTFIAASLVGTAFSLAQENPSPFNAPANSPSSGPADQDLESLYDQMDQQSDTAQKKEETVSAKPEEKPVVKTPTKQLPEAKSITDLNQLQPFSDIAVISRRFLPKTHRFELSLVGQTNLNNPFFNNFGGSAKVAYYLTEQYAIEAIGTGLSIGPRQVTTDMASIPGNGITTSNVVTARTFFGAALKWNPIYGKVSFLNHSIVPFDLSFSLGGGMTGTDQNREEPTVHLGTSQIFAISKSWGLRWDLDWNFYNAHAIDSAGNATMIFHNDLFIGIGASVYFPEATYR